MGKRDHRQRKRRSPWRSPPRSGLSYLPVVVKYRAPYSNVWEDASTYSAVNRQIQFSGLPVTRGDHKTPNAIEYFKYVGVEPCGTIQSEDAITGAAVRTSGPLTTHVSPLSYARLYNFDPFDAKVMETAERRALHKFFDQALNSDLNLTVDVAELHQTRDMLARRSNQIGKLFRKLHNYSGRYWKRILRNAKRKPGERMEYVPPFLRKCGSFSEVASATWLEWKLGWTPLIGSLFGIADHATNIAKNFRVTGNAKQLFRQFYVRKPNGYWVWNDIEISSYATVRGDLRVRNPMIYNATRVASLNPVALAYELTRLSFVLDYFIDVGTYLREIETSLASGLELVRGYQTRTLRCINRITVPEMGNRMPNGELRSCLSVAKGQEYVAYKQRLILGSMPLPHLPKWEPKLGWQRLVTLAALGRTLFFK